jgi:phosphoribosylanthranilate isomerase
MNSLELCKLAIELEINYLGFILYSRSPRNVSFDFLKEVQSLDFQNTKPVLVLVNPNREDVEKALELMPQAILQFHGDESEEFCKSFKQPYWKAIGISDDSDFAFSARFSSAEKILYDTKIEGSSGGTGTPFDWNVLKARQEKNFVLAGGINIHNLNEALKLNPAVIDINSGIECSPGQKSDQLMTEVMQALKK